MSQIVKGQKAPDFSILIGENELFRLSEQNGHAVVVYFYPKDDTSGCTKEAIDFSALKPEFDAINVNIVGISPDSLKKHEKFKHKHSLTVTLGADEEHKILESYGVWVEKSMYGKKYMGVERTTFLIDSQGMIAEIWHKVSVPNHAQNVLSVAKALCKEST